MRTGISFRFGHVNLIRPGLQVSFRTRDCIVLSKTTVGAAQAQRGGWTVSFDSLQNITHRNVIFQLTRTSRRFSNAIMCNRHQRVIAHCGLGPAASCSGPSPFSPILRGARLCRTSSSTPRPPRRRSRCIHYSPSVPRNILYPVAIIFKVPGDIPAIGYWSGVKYV